MPRYFVTLIVAVALFMETMDSTVIATSLPAIAKDLGEDPIALKLALTSYLLSLAVFIPLSGWAADRYGARTVFRAAIVVFTLGSAACGFASSLFDFVLFRIVQGIGGAMMVPVGRLVILRTVPKSELISALAWLTIPALMGPVIGPPLGGFITTFASWRWIFWINIPIGVLGVILATYYIQNFREEDLPPLDVKGFILSGIGLSGLAFGFTTIGQGLFPPVAVAALLIVGFIGCWLYVRHARIVTAPLIDLSLLKIDTFFASVVGGFIYRVGIGATPFLLPLLLQLGFGLTPVPIRHAHLLDRGRRHRHEDHGGADPAPLRLQAGARDQRRGERNLHRRAGFVHADHAARLDPSVALGRRLLQVAAIHEHQHARLCRHRAAGDERGDELCQRRAATVDVGRRRRRRAGARDPASRTRGHGGQASDFTTAFVVVGLISAASAFIFMRLPKSAGASLAGPARPVGAAREKIAEAEARVDL